MESIQDILKRGRYFPPTAAELDEQLNQLLQNPEIQDFVKQNQDKITREQLKASLSALIDFESEIKYYHEYGSARAVPGFKPTLALGHETIQVAYIKTKDTLAKEQAKQVKQEIRYLHIPKAIREAKMNEIDVTKDNQEIVAKLVEFAKEYVKNSQKFHKGLYIWGEFGLGKTYLMGALVNNLAQKGYSSTFVNTATFISDLKGHFQDGNYVNEEIERIKKAPLLILDDIGAESITEWTRDEVLGVILQYRMQEELPTLFTSNLSFRGLLEHFTETRDKNDVIKAERIMERIYFLADEYRLDGINRRH